MGFLLSWWKCSRIDCGNGCPTLGIYEQPLNCTEDEMLGWYYWLNGHESEQAPGDSEEQRSLACCSPWGCEELDMTEQLNNWTVHFKWVNCMVCKFYLKKLSPKKKNITGKRFKASLERIFVSLPFPKWLDTLNIYSSLHICEWVSEWVSAFSVVSDSLWPHELYPPGSSIYRILQARILEWVSICFSTIHTWLCQNKVNMIFIVDPNLLDDKSETQAPFIEILIQNITFNIFNRKHRTERKDGSSSSPFLDSLPWSISGH